MIFLMDLDIGSGKVVRGFLDAYKKDGVLSDDKLSKLRNTIGHNIFVKLRHEYHDFDFMKKEGFESYEGRRGYFYFIQGEDKTGFVAGIDNRGKVSVDYMCSGYIYEGRASEVGWCFVADKNKPSIKLWLLKRKLQKVIQEMVDSCPEDI